jgi:tetratricopeptide (TPR) repeat protein
VTPRRGRKSWSRSPEQHNKPHQSSFTLLERDQKNDDDDKWMNKKDGDVKAMLTRLWVDRDFRGIKAVCDAQLKKCHTSDYYEYYVQRGLALERLGQLRAALGDINEAAKHAQTPTEQIHIHNCRSRIYYKRSDYVQSLAELLIWKQMDPADKRHTVYINKTQQKLQIQQQQQQKQNNQSKLNIDSNNKIDNKNKNENSSATSLAKVILQNTEYNVPQQTAAISVQQQPIPTIINALPPSRLNLPNPKPKIHGWSRPDEVARWLCSLGSAYQGYSEKMIENHVDGQVLKSMVHDSPTDRLQLLKAMGIHNILHQRVILASLRFTLSNI